ncbi:quinolinate phosphoribosyl transferase [Cereibacter sphaeroides]|uniref:quinolinate phosphoribosyl transferase n=1 Tax=Cereibacter sphaeroides TaxID=1063 RepID=UPI00313C0E80
MLMLDDVALHCLLKRDRHPGVTVAEATSHDSRGMTVTLRAGAAGTVCGLEEAERIFTLLGCAVHIAAASGARVETDDLLVAARGPLASLTSGWQPAHSLIEWASGVATATADFVAAARAANPGIVVACPRKAIPGARPLALKAAVSGGAVVQLGASPTPTLILAEHFAFEGAASVRDRVAQMRQTDPGRPVVVEVETLAHALAAADLGADMIQLRKMRPDEVAATARSLDRGWTGQLIAAGAIPISLAAAYATSGADVLMTSMPYHAPLADIRVAFERD